jgi:predicted hydrocarbon binding protein
VGQPRVPIVVDDATGVWSVDGMPMILVPWHFFMNNHLAIEAALGAGKYAELLFAAGHKSAYAWCEREARTHGLNGVEVFEHYMRRLSQRGWGQFKVESVEPATGHARVSVTNSAFVLAHSGAPRKTCYMFRGWFPGALEFVGAQLGKRFALACEETQCAADGQHAVCVFEAMPRAADPGRVG